jgi:ParB family chromosome partitioning protein
MAVNYRVDWQTPDKYLDAARSVLGEIELDPATSKRAQERIQAQKYYTRHDSCLDHEWHGKVWMNPAYTLLPQMTDRLIRAYQAGDVPEAIFMTHTATSWELWFQAALRVCTTVCFVSELVEWYPGHKDELAELGVSQAANPDYDERGTVVFYFGQNIDNFRQHFEQFGVVKS